MFLTAAFLSAFLDALTVTAVLIGVTIGFYRIFHLVSSNKEFSDNNHDYLDNSSLNVNALNDFAQFKSFLQQLIMHGAVGTRSRWCLYCSR